MYSAGSGVKSVVCVLSSLSFRLFICVHVYMFCRYCVTCCSAICIYACVDVIVMSSAYVIIFMLWLGGVGMSDVYMLKRKGERTPPCGTPQCRVLLAE